ncbi:hypothetical protein B0I37DRAFT_218177 [Chaetomium sp. MPI-CAGE-AT-0009]|nr:hypothetical protein B0I37DRAFT_218177 [Chaetomium sp. MPI-CAGE-AT-0009]
MESGRQVRLKAAGLHVKWPRRPDPSKGEMFEDKTFLHFDPSQPEDFHNWVLLEVVTNFAVKHGNPTASSQQHHAYFQGHTHPRGHAMELVKAGEEASFQRYRYLTAMVGPSFQNIQRLQQIEGPSDYKSYDRAACFAQGSSPVAVSALVPAIHPEATKPFGRKREPDECPDSGANFTEPDVFLWVDLTYPLRGVYLPLTLEDDNTTCVYAHFDFTRGDAYDLQTYTYHPEPDRDEGPDFAKDEPDLPAEEKNRQASQAIKRPTGWDRGTMRLGGGGTDLGWGVQPGWTARFDVGGLKELAMGKRSGQPADYIRLFDSKGILIRIGGDLKTRVEKVYKDPVHTMNEGEVVESAPAPV